VTDYSDVPGAAGLVQQNDQINDAVYMLNNGGTMMNFTIGMPPPAPGEPTISLMPVSIVSYPPMIQDVTRQDLLTLLQQKSDDIIAQLAAMGVTNPPTKGAPPKGMPMSSGSMPPEPPPAGR